MTIGQRSTLSGDPVAVPGLERAVPDLSIAATDRPLRPGQYVYVETHAWWLTTHGPHQLLAEHRLRQWVPADAERPWVLEREVTGAQEWLNGSAEAAAALPDEFIDRVTLIGPPGHVKERIAALREAGVTHLHVLPFGSETPKLLSQVKEWIS